MLVGLQLGDLQEVGAAGADVHAVDGEHVFADTKLVAVVVDVERGEGGVGAVVAAAGGGGVPRRVFRRMVTGDLMAVDVGNEAVVALHAQQQIPRGLDVVDTLQFKREPEIKRGGAIVHLLGEVELGRDEFLETGLRLVAGAVGPGDPLGVIEPGFEPLVIVLAAGRHPGASRDGAADEGFAAAALQCVDHLDDVIASFFVVAGLALEAALPLRIKIDYRALEQRPLVVTKLPLEQWLPDGLHVTVHTEVAAVDGDLGEGAAGAG